jgi:hypothetical protein
MVPKSPLLLQQLMLRPTLDTLWSMSVLLSVLHVRWNISNALLVLHLSARLVPE